MVWVELLLFIVGIIGVRRIYKNHFKRWDSLSQQEKDEEYYDDAW